MARNAHLNGERHMLTLNGSAARSRWSGSWHCASWSSGRRRRRAAGAEPGRFPQRHASDRLHQFERQGGF